MATKNKERIGVLIANIGSPQSPNSSDVRRYLREFLSDPRVLDMNPVFRALLLYGVILPIRPSRSAKAYKEIWTDEGSPLIVHSIELCADLERYLNKKEPGRYSVKPGMRYGNPSFAQVLHEFEVEGIRKIIVLPLFPQYASSTTGSTIEALYALAGRRSNPFYLDILDPYFDNTRYLNSLAKSINEQLGEIWKKGPKNAKDFFLFSFHGLPERQIARVDAFGHCFSDENCCKNPGPSLTRCYRAQCFHTARATARLLKLRPNQWGISFQSRMGRIPWIRPYTDEMIASLAARGLKRLIVAAPSFAVDCLETLEELGIRARQTFLGAGGGEFHYLHCINNHSAWTATLRDMILKRQEARTI